MALFCCRSVLRERYGKNITIDDIALFLAIDNRVLHEIK